ncbi:hypothetical protein B0H11DRAFT_1908148 [Mycena galericulata]|nr:hypothetical protein B0H11DRAFT_1908148 [Mycena galericulata]
MLKSGLTHARKTRQDPDSRQDSSWAETTEKALFHAEALGQYLCRAGNTENGLFRAEALGKTRAGTSWTALGRPRNLAGLLPGDHAWPSWQDSRACAGRDLGQNSLASQDTPG